LKELSRVNYYAFTFSPNLKKRIERGFFSNIFPFLQYLANLKKRIESYFGETNVWAVKYFRESQKEN